MKIGDIKVGEEYGAVDNPTRRRRFGGISLPRRVRVEEVVLIPEERWSSGAYTSTRKTVNARRLRVTFLDETTSKRESSWDKIEIAKRGTSLVIEARQVVGPWAALRKDVLARIEAKQKQAEAEAALHARVKALLGTDERRRGWWRTSVRESDLYPELDVNGDYFVERLLSLAEKGLEASR